MRRLLIAAALLLAALSVSVQAETPADAIKYRQSIMSAMGAHIGALSLIYGNRVPHQAHLQSHADALAALGAQAKVVFGEGTGTGKTDALPIIWQEPERFAKALADNEKATADLKAAVASGDKAKIGLAFKNVGQSCKGCHDRYRKAEEKK